MAARKLTKALTRIVIVLALLAAVPFVASLLVDANFYKPLVEKQLGKALGARVTIEQLRVKFFPRIHAEALNITGGDFFKAESLSANAEFLPLFIGKVRIGSVEIKGFEADAPALATKLKPPKQPPGETAAQVTEQSQEQSADQGGGPRFSINIQRVLLDEGIIKILCRGSGKKKVCRQVHVLNLEVELPTELGKDAHRYRARGDVLALGALPLSIEIELDKQLTALIDGGEASLSFRGDLKPAAPYAVNGRADLKGKDLNKFAELLVQAKLLDSSASLPSESFALGLDAKGELGGRVALDDVKIQLGEQAIIGDGNIDFGKAAYGLKLAGKNLQLTESLPILDSLLVALKGKGKVWRLDATVGLAKSIVTANKLSATELIKWRVDSGDFPILVKRLAKNARIPDRLPKKFAAEGSLNLGKGSLKVAVGELGDAAFKGGILFAPKGLQINAEVSILNLDKLLPPPATPATTANGGGEPQPLEAAATKSAFPRLGLVLKAQSLIFRDQRLDNLALTAEYDEDSKSLEVESLAIKGGLASDLRASGHLGKGSRLSLSAENLDLVAAYRLAARGDRPPFKTLPRLKLGLEQKPSTDLKAEGSMTLPKQLGDEVTFKVVRVDGEYDISAVADRLALPTSLPKGDKGKPPPKKQQSSATANGTANGDADGTVLAELLASNGKVKAKVASLAWQGYEFKDLQVVAELASATLQIKRLTAGLAEGELSAVGQLTTAKAEGELNGKALRAAAFAPLLVKDKRGLAQGIINGDLKFSFAPSEPSLSMKARGKVRVEKPLIVGADLAKINNFLRGKSGLIGFTDILNTALVGGESRLTRLELPIVAADGIIRITPKLSGESANGVGKVGINLKSRALSGNFSLKFAATEAPPLEVSFDGTIDEPKISVADGALAEFAVRRSLEAIDPKNLGESLKEGLGENADELIDGLRDLLR